MDVVVVFKVIDSLGLVNVEGGLVGLVARLVPGREPLAGSPFELDLSRIVLLGKLGCLELGAAAGEEIVTNKNQAELNFMGKLFVSWIFSAHRKSRKASTVPVSEL